MNNVIISSLTLYLVLVTFIPGSEQDTSQVLTDMSSRISTLEDKTADRDRVLQEIVKTLSNVIRGLREKGKVCAFTASYMPGDKIKKGDKMFFMNVILNLGNGYNATTGVFTAPQSGLYSFTLSVMTGNEDDWVIVNVKAKGAVVTSLYARDDEAWGDQSSTSVTVRLSKGDRVYPFVWDTNTDTLDNWSFYSVFTGYLVHGM